MCNITGPVATCSMQLVAGSGQTRTSSRVRAGRGEIQQLCNNEPRTLTRKSSIAGDRTPAVYERAPLAGKLCDSGRAPHEAPVYHSERVRARSIITRRSTAKICHFAMTCEQ
jgi:hypothetical protein